MAIGRRHLTVLALVAIVLLAGCGDDGSPTTTEPTGTTDPPATTTAGSVTYPPGVSAAGVTDVAALTAAHRTTLLTEGVTIRLAVSTDDGEGSSQVLSLGPDATVAVVAGNGTDAQGRRQSVDAWLNETHTVFRFRANGSTEYRVLDRSPGVADLVWAGNVQRYVEALADEFRVTGADSREGVSVVTLRATGDLENATPGEDTTVEMAVDERGVVRSFVLEQTQSEGERYGIDYAVTDLGVTPTRPDWVATVPAGAFLDVDLSIEVLDGSVVELRNDGPDDVPPGASVTLVDAGGARYDGALDAAVDAGETRYVWVTTDDTLAVAPDRPAPDAARSLGGRAVVVVESADGVRLATADLAWRDGGSR